MNLDTVFSIPHASTFDQHWIPSKKKCGKKTKNRRINTPLNCGILLHFGCWGGYSPPLFRQHGYPEPSTSQPDTGGHEFHADELLTPKIATKIQNRGQEGAGDRKS